MRKKPTLPAKGVSRISEKRREQCAKAGAVKTARKAKSSAENGRKGNPTTYKPEYCDLMLKFFGVDETEKRDGKTAGVTFPTFQRFARMVGVTTETMNEWRKKFPEFAQAHARAKDDQARILIVNSLAGHYYGSFPGLFAKNCLGWRDKVAITDEEGGAVKHDVTLQSELERRQAALLEKVARMAAVTA